MTCAVPAQPLPKQSYVAMAHTAHGTRCAGDAHDLSRGLPVGLNTRSQIPARCREDGEAACTGSNQEDSHIESPPAAVSSAEQSSASFTGSHSNLCEFSKASVIPKLCSSNSMDDNLGSHCSQSSSQRLNAPQRQVGGHFRSSATLACSVLVLLLASSTSGAGVRINSGATDGSYTQLTWDAYQTSDNDTVFPRLATYFPPGTFFGDSTFVLGDTSYR